MKFFTKLLILSILSLPLSSHAADFDEIISKSRHIGFSGIISYRENNNTKIEAVNSQYDQNTRFALGSITKLFTQMAILQLNERGLIRSLSDPIGKYLKPEQTPSTWLEWTNKITVIDLIKHHSGLPALLYPEEGQKSLYNHVNEPGNLKYHFFSEGNSQFNSEMLDENMKHADVDGEFYSNIGYNILAVIIENMTSLSYHEYLKENIFIPAGMRHSFSGSDTDVSLLALVTKTQNMASPKVYAIDYNVKQDDGSYTSKLNTANKTTVKDYNFVFTVGAGSIVSTVTDLNKWIYASFYSDEKLLSKKSLDTFKKLDADSGLWGHSGELPGYQSVLLLDFSNKKQSVILSNLNIDAYNLMIEIEGNTSKNIIDFESRGFAAGITSEVLQALDNAYYLTPVNISVSLLLDE